MNARRLGLTLSLLVLVIALAVTGCSLGGDASKFPEKTVTMYVGSGAGGGVDTATRGIQPYLQKHLGGSVVVEQKVGNSGLMAANFVYESKPDGYSIFVGTNGYSLIAQLYPESWKPAPKAMYDAFISVYSWVNQDGNGIIVKKDSPFKTMADLAAEAQKRPIKFGLTGSFGGTDQITAMCVRKAYGGSWTLVPMDSGAEVVAGVLGGTYDVGSGSLASPTMDPANLRALAVTTSKRFTRFPDGPTFAELGKPQCTIQFVIGAMVPLGTPQDVVDKLATAFDKARNDPDYIAWATKANQPIGDKGWDGKTFYTFLKDYVANMQPIIPDLQEELRKAQQGTTPTPTK